MTACDTGFFVEYLDANDQAAEILAAARTRREKLVISVVSLYELRRLALKGVIDQKRTEKLLTILPSLCRVVYLDRDAHDLLEQSARLAHGNGLSMADSLVLGSALQAGADTLYTTDSDLAKYKGEKGPKVVML